jgi:hypothetical protein
MIRRLAATAATVVVLTVPLSGVAMAQATPVPAPVPVGPECRPSVTSGVIAALAGTGVPLPAGRKIQYLQVSQRADGVYFLELCVVTIPS